MKKALLPLILSGFFIGSAFAQQSIPDQVEGLKKLAEVAAAAQAATVSKGSTDSIRSEFRGGNDEFSGNLSMFQSYLQNGSYDQALQILQRWKVQTKNEQVKTALTTLIESLQKEQQKRIVEITKRFEELNAQTAATIVKMTSPDEVDAIQQKYEDFRSVEFPNGGSWANSMYNRINRVTSFLQYWRQFLVAQDEGNFSQAMNALTNLRNNGTAGLITSKEIGARYTALLQKQLAAGDSSSPLAKAVATLMADVKTPAQIPPVYNKLNALTSGQSLGGDDRMIYALRSQLGALARIQDDFNAGAYARVISAGNNSSSESTPYDAQLDALNTQLRVQAIIKANDLTGLGTPKPGEGLASFVHTAAEQAYQKKDWPSLFKLLTVYSNVSGGGCSYTGNMQEGVRAFLAGQQLEQAGQIAKAIDQYTICLTQLGPLVPRDEAKQAINQLQTRSQGTHP